MIDFSTDKRVVMTLDAGGTNFVFSAISENREIVEPVHASAPATDLNACLEILIDGFEKVKAQLKNPPVAISFAFPGPADYVNGIIGDLQNLPAFRGGIPLGPFLNEHFKIPAFINNDGDLFAYGEAMSGAMPEINQKLREAGSSKQYKNLLGLTLGTGFGGGIVIDGRLLLGDNGAAGEIWVMRNKTHNNSFAEESISKRAIIRVYNEITGRSETITPKDIFDIAEGNIKGDRTAALESFRQFGEAIGDAIANAITLIDGLVIIGGGLAGASKYFMPAIINELNGNIKCLDGQSLDRLEVKAYDLDNAGLLNQFCKSGSKKVEIPGTKKVVDYNSEKRIGVLISKLGASRAIALGAYAFALNKLE